MRSGYDPRYQVKQHVGIVRGRGGAFRVFKTGDSKCYLFSTIAPDGTEGGLQFPVMAKDLIDDVRRALSRGLSYDHRGIEEK